MVTGEDLKQIIMLSDLTDPMLAKIADNVDVLRFDRDDIVFKQNEPAERFFMLVKGSILLQQTITDKVTACLDNIKPGYSFGWSAMIADALYTSDAVCVEPSQVFSLKRSKSMKLFDQDPSIGYNLHKQLLVIIKDRYDYRSEQFRRAIMNHPDMQELFRT